jgi:transposase
LTKIHFATDALGNSVHFILTGGQRNDITQAELLLQNLFHDHVIADKGYDSAEFVLWLKNRNSKVVIPSKVNCKTERIIDLELYKERHLIECCIEKLKHFR